MHKASIHRKRNPKRRTTSTASLMVGESDPSGSDSYRWRTFVSVVLQWLLKFHRWLSAMYGSGPFGSSTSRKFPQRSNSTSLVGLYENFRVWHALCSLMQALSQVWVNAVAAEEPVSRSSCCAAAFKEMRHQSVQKNRQIKIEEKPKHDPYL